MKARALRLLDGLYTSYWFLPAVMTACGGGLSFLTVHLDRILADALFGGGWLYAGGPEGARAVLQTVDYDALFRTAEDANLIVMADFRPGESTRL